MEGVDKESLKNHPIKNTLTRIFKWTISILTKKNFTTKSYAFKKKADSAEKKGGKEEKRQKFKKDLYNSFLELKDKDGLEDFGLNTYWEYNDLEDNTDAMLTGHHIGASLRAALEDPEFIGGLEATRLGHFIEQMFTFDALNDYFKKVKK